MTEPNWIVLILSSALISALVNAIWNALSKYIDHKKETRKHQQKISHTYLAIANDLEVFAKKCDAQLYDIYDGLRERAEFHDERKLDNIGTVELDFSSNPDWQELPIKFVAEIKSLPTFFNTAHEWISSQWFAWADTEETFAFEEERLAYYGLIACKKAENIREKLIKVQKGNTEEFENHFNEIIEKRREQHIKNPDKSNLIPELHNHFKK
ncbi:hypothetical protein JW897_12370 [Chromobacterium alkanivorans]|uniref:hypothetical protein n=1 Tax=Chromobacterium alkanivorans TaxID=1071719 RepID=UPI00196728C8|nr:hypothetical protein [Chromobacterium alkanivorans]MBN3004531.1 hypothetical protein [Chromobacterium alkanivorans]